MQCYFTGNRTLDTLPLSISPVILWFDLKQIATQTILEVSSTEKCALQHTKSPKEFLKESMEFSHQFVTALLESFSYIKDHSLAQLF